jgi:hypothetical protein
MTTVLTQTVGAGSTVYTDGLASFSGLENVSPHRPQPARPIGVPERRAIGRAAGRPRYPESSRLADRDPIMGSAAGSSRRTWTSSSFVTIAASIPWPRSSRCLGSGPAVSRRPTRGFEATAICSGQLANDNILSVLKNRISSS